MWLLIWIFRLSIAGSMSGTSSQSLAYHMKSGEECVTSRYGVTHCWENLGTWDPRPAPSEWQPNAAMYDPKDFGYYPTEKVQ